MVSRDWRPIKLRARSQLRVLIAISAPPAESLTKIGLAPVDFENETMRVKAALGGVEVRVLGGPGSPFTLDRLIEALRDGIDILYVVSHGMFGRATGAPALILQDDTGAAKPIKGEDVAVRLAELQKGPRLVVLASCQSAGDGNSIESSQRSSVQATLAGRIADAGIPAILAMQGFISMTTIEMMMPVFFAELLRDGQLDRALATARGKVRDRHDAWMPALFTRLSNCRLWYTPGFAGGKGQEVWRRLLKPVREGRVVALLGPRLVEAAYGTAHEIATRLAGASNFPFATYEWDDLPRVTSYMSVKESRYNVVRAYQEQILDNLIERHRHWLPPAELPPATKSPKLGKLIALVGDHLRETNSNDIYRILAELPTSIYVTTNFDPLLERALKHANREPQQVLTRWRYHEPPQPADEQSISEPSVQAPLVYHVFGAFGPNTDNSLVFTEDDHFDFLMEAAAYKLVPPEVESALVDNSLLFLGFRLTDWHFRVLFRLMMGLPGRERLKQYCHVAVQSDPDMQVIPDVEGAKAYLAEYFGKEANIDIYWGSTEDFLTALRDELAAAGSLATAPEQDNDDEWNF
jgi:hypothetical protein